MQIDPSGGAPTDTGIAGTLPAEDGELSVDISQDASSAVVWRGDDFCRADAGGPGTGSQAPVALPRADVDASRTTARSPPAPPMLWDDGR